MGRIRYNAIINGVSGKLGNVVLRHTRQGRTYISSRPDRSKVKLSAKQKKSNEAFSEAVQYAQDILNDPEKNKHYKTKLKPGQTVYHAAVKEYMDKEKESGRFSG
jgi:hypothetical protein